MGGALYCKVDLRVAAFGGGSGAEGRCRTGRKRILDRVAWEFESKATSNSRVRVGTA